MIEHVGGIILCGGQSRRMTMPKATLPFGPETMLGRVVRLLSEVVAPIVVVAAPNQSLPPLPHSVVIARDEQEGLGPMAGLCAGLKALPRDVTVAFVTSCDVPLLVPDFVRKMIDELGLRDVAMPVDHEWRHPLAAVYRTRVLPIVEKQLAANQLRLLSLLDHVDAQLVPTSELIAIDPGLLSFKNCNVLADYVDALRVAGFDEGSNPVGVQPTKI